MWVAASLSKSEENDNDRESSGIEEIVVTRVQNKEPLNVFPAF